MIECETCILEKIVHYCEVDCLALEDALKEHDKQIRADVIDEAYEQICKVYENYATKCDCTNMLDDIIEVLEQLKSQDNMK